MRCSNVGIEIWFLFLLSAVLLYLFTIGARPFQRWLRFRRPRSMGLRMMPAVFFDESNLWSMRALGVIPALMLVASILGLVCYFRGPG